MSIPAIQVASDAHLRRFTERARVHVSVYQGRMHIDLHWLDGALDGNNAVLAILSSGIVKSADFVLWDSEHQYAAELDVPAAKIVREIHALSTRMKIAQLNAAAPSKP